MARKNEDYIKAGVIAGNNTGKTTWLLNQAKKIYDVKNTDRVLIYIDQDPPALAGVRRFNSPREMANWKHGIAKYYNYQDPMGGVDELMQLCYDGKFGRYDNAFIFDDCKNYMKANAEGAVTRFMANHRTYHIDLYFVSHSFNDMPRYVCRRLDAYIVGKVRQVLQSPKLLEDLEYAGFMELYKGYVQVMKAKNNKGEPDMYAKKFVNCNDVYKDFDKIVKQLK